MSQPRRRPPAAPRKPQQPTQRGPHLYRRGRVWYARGGALGREGVSLHTRDAAEAGERLRAILARTGPGGARPVGRAQAVAAPPELTLAEALARWLEAPHGYTSRTLQSARNRLAAWAEWHAARGVTLASQITPETVDRWVAERSAKVSRRTVNRDLRAARVAIRWAVDRKLLGPCPALTGRAELREPTRPRRREVPDPGELARVLAAVAHPRYRAALEALAATGLRVEELRRLEPRHLVARVDGSAVLHVEPEAGAADTAEPTKGYRARSITLAAPAAAAVRRYLDAARAGRRKTPPTERHLLTQIAQACDAAGVPRCGLHDLRRAFATEAFRAGVPLTVIAGWLGHADVRTTEGYVVAYRSDAGHVAPVPRALAGQSAESVQSPGTTGGSRGPTRRGLRVA